MVRRPAEPLKLSGSPKVKFRRAVCEVCRRPNATHTQVLNGNEPVVEGMPAVIPENGDFSYKPVCRDCFVRKDPRLVAVHTMALPFGAAVTAA